MTTPEIIDRTSRWKPEIKQTIAAYCKQHTQHTTAQNAALIILNMMVDIVTQGYTNSGGRVARATKFCTVAANIRGPSVCKFHYINGLTPKNVDVAARFLKNFTPLQ